MRNIALVARGALIYQNRPVAAGEVFQATPIDAAVLRYRREVDFAPRGARPTPLPSTSVIAEGASTLAVRRYYQDTQDKQNDVPAPASPLARLIPDRVPDDDIEDPPTEDVKPRKRRQYKRRDLVAEE